MARSQLHGTQAVLYKNAELHRCMESYRLEGFLSQLYEHTSSEQDLGGVLSSLPAVVLIAAQGPAGGLAGACRYCNVGHVPSEGTTVFAPVYQPARQHL